jgi:hypothetical protein
MKKIFFALFLCLGLLANAQYTTPRVGVGANNDNTFRTLTFKYIVATDVAGADTIKVNFNGYTTHVKVALIDSLSVTFNSLTNCYLGDVVKFTINGGTSGNKLKFLGNFVAASTSIAVSTGKKATIQFIFDGAKWIETGRVAF